MHCDQTGTVIAALPPLTPTFFVNRWFNGSVTEVRHPGTWIMLTKDGAKVLDFGLARMPA